MSEDPAAITFRVIQELMPEYHIPPDLLNGVFAAIPPPPAAATAAWRHARVTRVIEEVAARVPMDAAQGHLAAQIAVFQFMADGLAAQIHAPGLDMLEMYRLTRLMDALAQTVARLERSLERRQFRVMPFRDVRAVDGFDLDAMDAVWCRREPADGPLLGAGPVGNLVGNSVGKLVGGSAEGSHREAQREAQWASRGEIAWTTRWATQWKVLWETQWTTRRQALGGVKRRSRGRRLGSKTPWLARRSLPPGAPRRKGSSRGPRRQRAGRRRRSQWRRRVRPAGPAYRHPDRSRAWMA